jgi:hypothetical protein
VLLPNPEALGAGAIGAHEHGLLSYASALLLLVLIARAVWRDGLRSWLGSLGEALALDSHPPADAHAHGHAHAHGEEGGHSHSHSHSHGHSHFH